MNISHRNVFLLWLAILSATVHVSFIHPTTAVAGESGNSQLSDAQLTGKRLFLQNCALCHSSVKKNNKNPADEGTSIAPSLSGRFSGPKALPDAVARTFIQKGVPKKMPSFQYSLEPNEVDSIVNYLKTL